jgi:hypothetical protein
MDDVNPLLQITHILSLRVKNFGSIITVQDTQGVLSILFIDSIEVQ